jgi:hypothetical protein
LVELLLPRFVQEGKKYATIAIGCTGGRHRSVYIVEKLAARLTARPEAHRAAGESGGWRLHVMHRELAREANATATPRGVTSTGATATGATSTGRAASRRVGDGTDADVVSSDWATDDRLGAWPLPAQAQEA